MNSPMPEGFFRLPRRLRVRPSFVLRFLSLLRKARRLRHSRAIDRKIRERTCCAQGNSYERRH